MEENDLNPLPSSRWSLPRGRILRRALRTDPTQEYLVYVPETAEPDAKVLVSVHGISRNAYEQAGVFSTLCDERGVILVVPIFTVEQNKDYQRLGRKGRGNRVDLLLHRYLAEVAFMGSADVTQIHLFGFSAGAQFAHRYLMAHPHRVARAVVAAAGWYTLPTQERRFPYGIRPVRTLEGLSFNPEQFLHVPVEVLIGQRDTGSNNLRSTEKLDAAQGKTRLDRARNWVAAMRAAAKTFGIEPRTTLTEVPEIEHSFTSFCERGALVERVGRALFDDRFDEARNASTSEVPASNGSGAKMSLGDSSDG